MLSGLELSFVFLLLIQLISIVGWIIKIFMNAEFEGNTSKLLKWTFVFIIIFTIIVIVAVNVIPL